MRSGDLLEIRICLRGTEPIVHPERGLCLRRQGLELARLKVFFKCMCEGKGSYKSILLPPPIPSLAPR